MGDSLQEDAVRSCVWEFIKLGALKVQSIPYACVLLQDRAHLYHPS